MIKIDICIRGILLALVTVITSFGSRGDDVTTGTRKDESIAPLFF